MLKSLIRTTIKSQKRVGRGISAGQGKTAGRGTKGQKSRSGYNIPRKFEGGQMPFSMRMPKNKGFKSLSKKPIIITLDQISSNFKAGDEITYEKLIEKKLISANKIAKILNTGKLTIPVTFKVPVSKSVVIPEKKKIADKEITNTEKSPVVSKTKPKAKTTSKIK